MGNTIGGDLRAIGSERQKDGKCEKREGGSTLVSKIIARSLNLLISAGWMQSQPK